MKDDRHDAVQKQLDQWRAIVESLNNTRGVKTRLLTDISELRSLFGIVEKREFPEDLTDTFCCCYRMVRACVRRMMQSDYDAARDLSIVLDTLKT